MTVRQLVQEPLTAAPKQLSRFPHYAMTPNQCIGHHVSLAQLREVSLVLTYVQNVGTTASRLGRPVIFARFKQNLNVPTNCCTTRRYRIHRQRLQP